MSASEKKRIVVYANPKQREVLNSAYRNKNDFTAEEYNTLSSETGLYAPLLEIQPQLIHLNRTVQWIKAWVVRTRKAKRNGMGSQPDEPPRRKAGRPPRQSNPEPTAIAPEMDPLPCPEDSFVLEAPTFPAPIESVASSSNPDQYGPLSISAGSHAYYHESEIYVPSTKPSASHLQQSWPGERPWIQSGLEPPTAISPTMDSLPHADDSFIMLARKVPTTSSIPAPISDASVAFSSTYSSRQYYHESEIHVPLEKPSNSQSQQPSTFNGPMLLPRQSHFVENIDPTLQGVPDQLNTWGTVPTSANSSKGTTTLVRSTRNTPVSYTNTPGPSKTSSGFAPPAVSLLLPRNQLSLSQPSPFCPSENTPNLLGWESPSGPSFSDAISKISSSQFRLFVPEHIIKQDNSETESPTTNFEFELPKSDSPTTTAFNTPIDDLLLCTTPLTKVNSVAFDVGKTPFRHLEVLHGHAVGSMTVDEMYDQLLDEDLAVRDPFQAAMGLVFMSRTGLNWSS
ncbi:hypothetical protein C8F04DRAFT_1398525 [Mycena alexandri]|uniref:Uncharacterized protein n=1 Tax=Mycena alexandri TaxID=1745969 RepID=A0AAD6SMC8_9AGAR|nr:hypothetical protein C8F04DRAFT_1398525 [Mycena alexandri]